KFLHGFGVFAQAIKSHGDVRVSTGASFVLRCRDQSLRLRKLRDDRLVTLLRRSGGLGDPLTVIKTRDVDPGRVIDRPRDHRDLGVATGLAEIFGTNSRVKAETPLDGLERLDHSGSPLTTRQRHRRVVAKDALEKNLGPLILVAGEGNRNSLKMS